MNNRVRDIGTAVVNHIYTILCIVFFLALAYNHLQLITFEVPLDYNEAGMLTLTETIAAGQDPFGLESQPTRSSVYPVLYNQVVAPLTTLFGNNLVLHRAVTAVFILSSCLLCFAMALRQSRSYRDSFAAACIFYAGLLYYSTPIAGPTGIGLFLFLASLVVPWLYNFSNRCLCVAIVLGILAFYAKQYFLASLGFVALYLFLAVSKGRGLVFGVSAFTVFLVTLLLVHRTSPYFLDNTVFATAYVTGLASSDRVLVKQLIEYGGVYLPVLLVLCAVLLARAHAIRGESRPHGQPAAGAALRNALNVRDLGAPLVITRLDYVWYCLFCSLLVIILSLGRNNANHLSYFFQLLSPFLLAGTVALAARFLKARWLFQLLMIAAFYNTYAVLQHDFSLNDDNWATIRREIAAADDLYASPVVLADILRAGKPFYENGHTRYIVLAENKPAFFTQARAGETPGALWTRHVDQIRHKLKTREFDLVLLDQWMAMPEDPADGESTNALLKEHYYRSGDIKLSLGKRPGGGNYRIQIWKPLRNSGENQGSSR